MCRRSNASTRALIATVVVFGVSVFSSRAELVSGDVRVESVEGMASYSVDQVTWLDLKPQTVLQKGAILRTSPGATADLVFDFSGTAIRLLPESTLQLARLDSEVAGENTIVEAALNLTSGSILGSQNKLAKPSRFQIRTPHLTAIIRGTEYSVRANGAVSCFKGEVSVSYHSPDKNGFGKANVPSGYSYNPDSHSVFNTPNDHSSLCAPHLDVVRYWQKFCKGPWYGHHGKPPCPVSPTHGHGDHGNGHGYGHDDHGNGHGYGHDKDYGYNDKDNGHGNGHDNDYGYNDKGNNNGNDNGKGNNNNGKGNGNGNDNGNGKGKKK